jgi:PAS domain S-box-containing protein
VGASLPDSAALDAAASPDALVCLDTSCEIVGVNAAFSRLTGVSAADVVGKSFLATFEPTTPDGCGIEAWPVAVALPGVRRLTETELRILHRGGRILPVAVTAGCIREGAAFAGAVLCMRSRAGRNASAAADAVATVAHEIRAPLTSIRGFASLLLRKADVVGPAERDDALTQIVADAERMTRLVGELLDVSRLEAGRVVVHRTSVPVAEVVARACDLAVRSVGAGAPVAQVPSDLVAWADPDMVLRVIVNLVENALKYGRTPITIDGDLDNELVRIRVCDAGYIPREQLRAIFGKFRRSEVPGRPSGTGLGLAIARGLAHAQGGRLAATSTPGTGSVFTLTLPAA